MPQFLLATMPSFPRLETCPISSLGGLEIARSSGVKAVKDGQDFPGHIPSLITALRPAVKAAQDLPGDLLDTAIKQSVMLNVGKLKTAGPILSEAVQRGKLQVAGGAFIASIPVV